MNQVDESNVNTSDNENRGKRFNTGLLVAGGIGLAGILLTAIAAPFVSPALRKHCLPYVPATDKQLMNIKKAINKHVEEGDVFLDIGSGDGRICRLASEQKLFSEVHGVELNYLLVLCSRLIAAKTGHRKVIKYHHKNLWQFPISNYNTICIFGVESMMKPLEDYIVLKTNTKQTLIACRFPFPSLVKHDEIGEGIDTVWIYKLNQKSNQP